jgi:hypothetical protein
VFAKIGLALAVSLASPTVETPFKGVSKFQAAFDAAWKSTLADRHQARVMPGAIRPGDSVGMHCSPTTLVEDSQLKISMQRISIPRKYSLVSVDEAGRIKVVISTTYGGYIGDNSIQPKLMRSGALITTPANATYGHMDDTGYPYVVFGPEGRSLILLLDDAIVFSREGIGTASGRTPKVIAGCAVSWDGPH